MGDHKFLAAVGLVSGPTGIVLANLSASEWVQLVGAVPPVVIGLCAAIAFASKTINREVRRWKGENVDTKEGEGK